ncbi:hypothetical protein FRACYDRAFT_161001, partial [Fragilariopsis cylindrus CCMP1102]
KSEFLAIMAHEIRTPLHQVTGFIDLLELDALGNLTHEQRGYIKLLKSSANQLMTVISDVLDYSKLEAGKMKIERIPFELLSVVQGSMEAVRGSCEEKGLTLTLEYGGDPNRLRQVLLNLLSNAVKFTEKGGIHVQVSSTNRPPKCTSNSTVTAAAATSTTTKETNIDGSNSSLRSPRFLKIVVTDTGMGISKENQNTIFEKYQQANLSVARNFGGTGLGLSICKLLVQETMDGSIGVDSD